MREPVQAIEAQTVEMHTVQIEQQYYEWKHLLAAHRPNRAEMEKWLFLHAANVLFGRKAGELLTLTTNQFDLNYAEQMACLDAVTSLWGVSCRVLHRNTISTKFIICRMESVQQQLDSVPPCILYDELTYPVNVTAADFLVEVERRWNKTGKIPHEIGLALGYPVKDVLGYMQLQPLPCSGCCGWQVYGEFAPSHRLCQAFVQARHAAIHFLHGSLS